jgi:hypothetical protein
MASINRAQHIAEIVIARKGLTLSRVCNKIKHFGDVEFDPFHNPTTTVGQVILEELDTLTPAQVAKLLHKDEVKKDSKEFEKYLTEACEKIIEIIVKLLIEKPNGLAA